MAIQTNVLDRIRRTGLLLIACGTLLPAISSIKPGGNDGEFKLRIDERFDFQLLESTNIRRCIQHFNVCESCALLHIALPLLFTRLRIHSHLTESISVQVKFGVRILRIATKFVRVWLDVVSRQGNERLSFGCFEATRSVFFFKWGIKNISDD